MAIVLPIELPIASQNFSIKKRQFRFDDRLSQKVNYDDVIVVCVEGEAASLIYLPVHCPSVSADQVCRGHGRPRKGRGLRGSERLCRITCGFGNPKSPAYPNHHELCCYFAEIQLRRTRRERICADEPVPPSANVRTPVHPCRRRAGPPCRDRFRNVCGHYAPTDNVSELTARTNDEGDHFGAQFNLNCAAITSVGYKLPDGGETGTERFKIFEIER